jgi:hypothetical protein
MGVILEINEVSMLPIPPSDFRLFVSLSCPSKGLGIKGISVFLRKFLIVLLIFLWIEVTISEAFEREICEMMKLLVDVLEL